MQMFIKKIVGKNVYSFVVDGKNLHELVMESQKLSFEDIKKCGCCGSDSLILNARVAEGFSYTEIRCQKCRASLVFGVPKKEKDTVYLRKNEDKTYQWKAYTAE